MPTLREGDKFLVDLVEADEVEMVREGCRAAEVWRVSELRGLDGTRLREAVKPNGALDVSYTDLALPTIHLGGIRLCGETLQK